MVGHLCVRLAHAFIEGLVVVDTCLVNDKSNNNLFDDNNKDNNNIKINNKSNFVIALLTSSTGMSLDTCWISQDFDLQVKDEDGIDYIICMTDCFT